MTTRRTFTVEDFEFSDEEFFTDPMSGERKAGAPTLSMSLRSKEGYVLSIDAPWLVHDSAPQYVGEVALAHEDDPQDDLATFEWSSTVELVRALGLAFAMVFDGVPDNLEKLE